MLLEILRPKFFLALTGVQLPQSLFMLRCSFCQKSENEIEKLVAGPNVYICNECVAVAARLMLQKRSLVRRFWNCVRSLRILKFALPQPGPIEGV
jgi:hypothetical protein